jgi:ABC-type glycerol-3-phosphate transport system substrate-binding protein
MIKKLLVLLLIVVTVTACNQGGSGPTPTPTPSKIVLIWWNLFEPEENVQPLIDAFEAANPNIEIQYEQKGATTGISGYRQELNTVLSDTDPNNNPDIFTIQNLWAGKYEQFISKAPASIIPADYLNDYYQVVRDDFGKNGVLALPTNMESLAVIYNKARLIEEGYSVPSSDWGLFLTQAKALTKRDAQSRIVSAGFSAGNTTNVEFMFDVINLLLLQNGVVMTNSAGDTATFASGDEATKAEGAVAFYNSFSSSQPTWSADLKKDIAAFLEKKLAMYVAPSWRLIDILNYNKQYNLGLDVGVAPVPQVGDGNIYWANYWGHTVSKESKSTTASWEFLKFITAAEQQLLLDQTVKQNGRPFGILFPRMSQKTLITEDTTFNPILGPYIQAVENAKTWNMVDGFEVQSEFVRIFEDGFDLEDYQSAVTNILKAKGTPP